MSLCRNSGDVLETFNFLENADDSDEEEESDMIEDIAEGKEKHRINKKHKVISFFHVSMKSSLKRNLVSDDYKCVMLKCLLLYLCHLNGL